MDKTAQSKFAAQAKIVKAMAHPSRLCIVDTLSRGERCVCDLRDLIGADMSTISRHLLILKNAGVVQAERRGSQVFYSLRIPCILNLCRCVDSVIQKSKTA